MQLLLCIPVCIFLNNHVCHKKPFPSHNIHNSLLKLAYLASVLISLSQPHVVAADTVGQQGEGDGEEEGEGEGEGEGSEQATAEQEESGAAKTESGIEPSGEQVGHH